MPLNQTPAQKRTVEAILHQAQDYVDMRFEQVRRINPHIEAIWDDVSWQQMTGLRISLASDKSFGPVRCHVGETLLGDDLRRAAEFFNPNSQVNLLGEIIEEREKETARTAGVLEIHDMRSLFRAVEPTLERIVTLLQTFVWWDLNDAVDLARFDKKQIVVEALSRDGLKPEAAEAYKEPLQTKEPTTEQVLRYEGRLLQQTVESFAFRRGGEQGYRIIVAREKGEQEDADVLVDMLHGQNVLLRRLRKGEPLDDQVKEQIARGLHRDAADVTPELAMQSLEKAVEKNRRRLGDALTGKRTGAHFDYKVRQLRTLQERLTKLNEEHNLGIG